jgi:1-acyl-sn-glycerol-3-phosphate acyltransferase
VLRRAAMPPTLFRIFAGSDSGQRLARTIADRFHAAIHGDEHLPRKGGALLVGNHAFTGFDALVLDALVIDRTRRPLRFLGERNLWRLPGIRALLDATGAIPGAPEEAVRLLEEGELVAVYPGGIDDSFKLSAEAYTLKWGERAGFARVALRARVPIVPVAATGIDEFFTLLRRETFLGRSLLGSPRYDIPLPSRLLPNFVPLDYHVLAPIPADGDPDDPDAVRRLRGLTHDALESVLGPYRRARAAGGGAEP